MKDELTDVHVDDLVEFMLYLEPEPPITTDYCKRRTWKGKKPVDVALYQSQKAHMCLWFDGQPTQGAGEYSRSKGNESSRVTYDRFMNPYGLLWMAEAFGESEDRLRVAMEAALNEKNHRNRCNAFRRIIPFDRLLELFVEPGRWRYDVDVKPLLEFDGETNAPYVPEENDMAFMEILKKEKCI